MVGKVGEFGHLEHEVDAGEHEVKVKIDLLASRKLTIKVGADDTRNFVCSAGPVKPFDLVDGYVQLWEGQLHEIASPNLEPPPRPF